MSCKGGKPYRSSLEFKCTQLTQCFLLFSLPVSFAFIKNQNHKYGEDKKDNQHYDDNDPPGKSCDKWKILLKSVNACQLAS